MTKAQKTARPQRAALPHVTTLNLEKLQGVIDSAFDRDREVADALAEDYGIATRSGAHCAPRLHRALGTEGQGAVRFSFGWYNTEEETDAAIRAVEELAR